MYNFSAGRGVFRRMNVTDSSRAQLGANAVVGVVAVQALMTLASGFLVSLVIEGLGFEAWSIVNTVVWTVIDLSLVASLFLLAAGLSSEDSGLVKATALALVAVTGLDLVSLGVERVFGSGVPMTLVWDVNLAVSLGFRVLLLAMFVKLAGPTQAWVLPVVGLVGVLTLARTGYSLASMHQLLPPELAGRVSTRLLFSGLSVVNVLGVLICAFGLRLAVLAKPQAQDVMAQAGLRPPEEASPGPAMEFLLGAVLLLLGLGVTFISYSAASGGGRYVVATGAIGSGLGMFIRGAMKLRK